jgi:hypothetical protein
MEAALGPSGRVTKAPATTADPDTIASARAELQAKRPTPGFVAGHVASPSSLVRCLQPSGWSATVLAPRACLGTSGQSHHGLSVSNMRPAL